MAEAPKRLKLCDDAFGGWWQVSDDTPAEEVIEYVRADIADAHRDPARRGRFIDGVGVHAEEPMAMRSTKRWPRETRDECATERTMLQACGEPTGRDGAGQDSLYLDDDFGGDGPFCEACFDDAKEACGQVAKGDEG